MIDIVFYFGFIIIGFYLVIQEEDKIDLKKYFWIIVVYNEYSCLENYLSFINFKHSSNDEV